ncbi:MAG: radical SAM protein [Candidatus Methanoperedens sp.]|nr:radical SAM protein [Candidatus Methanoperedens sp.]MCZ7403859.1 radical SAM protein [Candidatus Methanoperedens sp.]
MIRKDNRVAIFNPASFDVLYLTPKEYSKLLEGENCAFQNISKKTFNLYYDCGIIVDKVKESEWNPVSVILANNFDTFPSRISGMRLLMGEKCNLKCSYCYVKEKRSSYKLAPHEAYRGLEILCRSNADKDSVTIQYFGGEPLLYFPLIKKCDRWLDELQQKYNIRKIYRNIVSNGTIMTDAIKKHLSMYKYGFSFSIDGKEYIHNLQRFGNYDKNTFQSILRNMKELRETNIKMSINITPTPENISVLDGIVEFFISELGIDLIYMNTPISTNRGEWNINGQLLAKSTYKARMKAFALGGTFISVFDRILNAIDFRMFSIHECVESDGTLFATYLPGNEFSVCDINWMDSKFRVSDDKIHLKKSYESIQKTLFPVSECHICIAVGICGGPCQEEELAMRKINKGPLDKDRCAFYQEAVELAIWHPSHIFE